MQKMELANRNGLKIVGVLESKNEAPRGTCIVQHGWGGHRDKDTVQAIKNAFLDAGFQTFNFDATHSFGESDSDFEQSISFVSLIEKRPKDSLPCKAHFSSS